MIYFNCDYMAGAHPDVLKALCDTNLIHSVGYGQDSFTAQARQLILNECGLSSGDVFFLQGGTQTNKLVIDRLLSRNDGVICVDSAHINVHEAGAIEADGHKILTIPAVDGKISADAIRAYIREFYADDTNSHMVRPAMVYISHPTEFGTLYSLPELSDISEACSEAGIPLYIDGARLAYALASPDSELSLPDIARLADVFYIGGTKCGALFGEAVVTRRPDLFPRFMSLTKLHGALLAKGRLVPVQFIALFSDRLYWRIGRYADDLALQLKEGLISRGFSPIIDSPTNQQFFRLPNALIDRLMPDVGFELWGPRGDAYSDVRFVTDWSTPPDAVTRLLSLI